jgi:hypothetical protein
MNLLGLEALGLPRMLVHALDAAAVHGWVAGV